MRIEIEDRSFWSGIGVVILVILYGSVMYTWGSNAAQVTRCEVR